MVYWIGKLVEDDVRQAIDLAHVEHQALRAAKTAAIAELDRDSHERCVFELDIQPWAVVKDILLGGVAGVGRVVSVGCCPRSCSFARTARTHRRGFNG